MVKQTIQIFCRLKPTKHTIGGYDVNDKESEKSLISFNVPRDLADGFINNKKENYDFSFDKIFDQESKQDEIFANVAEPVIENVLSGFNGTIFAYGQTGSGKTFTITGGAERYIDRGIIPRTLSHIFEYITNNIGYIFTTHVSYLEIYNENGYDLLDPKHEASKLEDLPKTSLLEDNDGNIHLKNLSIHQAYNEEEALNLLFLGDTNRMIAETPMNQASTRSHCIFTIHISVTQPESATIHKSKLHLVDLAGSERVSKTGVGGTLLKEAKYINLSLHYLEQVIIALSEKSRSHIPYRNSMMTSVLRDSLGGNCMTSMIATCSVEKKNIDESISTCRFAQRVAMIKNDAILNEELDPKLMIIKLKREIQQLKDELTLSTGVQYDSELTDEDKERIVGLVKCYIEDKDIDARLSVGSDMRKINYCFQLLKKYCINNNQIASNPKSPENGRYAAPSLPADPGDSSYLANTTELKKLKDLILQRDNEINILVSMLKKEKKRADTTQRNNLRQNSTSSSLSSIRSDTSESGNDKYNMEELPSRSERNGKNALLKNLNHKTKATMSLGRQEAYEIFKRDYHENKNIEENKKGLKNRYTDAKKLGEQVNKSREAINSIKTKLEKHKIRASLNAASNGDLLASKGHNPEEQSLRVELDREKSNYKHAFNSLKVLKTEIEHMQHLLEKSKLKMQKDFELWWADQAATLSEQQNLPPQEVKAAWRTPPLQSIESINKDVRHDRRRNQSKSSDITRSSFSSSVSSSSHLYDELSSHPISRTGNKNYYTDTSRDQSHNHYSTPELKTNSKQSNDISNSQSRQTYFKGSSRPSSNIRLTGDPKTDEDILAFMKAREQLMQKARK